MILNFVQRSVSIYFVGFVCGGAFERINNVKKQEIQTTYCLEEKETPFWASFLAADLGNSSFVTFN